jgi:hypothetical protein
VERPFKRRDISIMNELSECSSKFEILRFAGFVLTLNLACATFGVENVVERPFKRRDIFIMHELSECSSKFEILRFAICRDRFDAEIAVRYVRCIEWSGNAV